MQVGEMIEILEKQDYTKTVKIEYEDESLDIESAIVNDPNYIRFLIE